MSIVTKSKNLHKSVDGGFRPQLTSLVDVMTILLVFLIKSFSVEGNLITPSKDMHLPFSKSEKPPRPACSVEITRNYIMAEGKIIAPLESVKKSDSLLIPPLFSWMKIQRAKCADSLKAPDMVIQCDRDVEFAYVKKVMYTCSKAGFVDFSVLVLQEE